MVDKVPVVLGCAHEIVLYLIARVGGQIKNDDGADKQQNHHGKHEKSEYKHSSDCVGVVFFQFSGSLCLGYILKIIDAKAVPNVCIPS